MTLITRAQWGARSPRSNGNAIGAHPKGVAIHWEGPKLGTRPHSACALLVRGVQNYHMDHNGWADIAYSFLACEHGFLFEGRGTGKGSAANGTTLANAEYYAVCGLVGVGDAVPTALKDGIRDGIDRCREAGAGSAVVAHSDLFATACPGFLLRLWVKAGAPRSVAPSQAASPLPAILTKIAAIFTRPKFAQLKVDGDFGPATLARLGQVLRNTSSRTNTIRAMQRYLHIADDGDWGRLTTLALQKHYGTPQDGVISRPDSTVIRAMQTRLNTNHF